jgi:phage N-6-adenine-methyltransferase
MQKLLAVSKLGKALKAHRKAKGFTQGALAKRAGHAERTIWLLERGNGTLGSFQSVLQSLGLSLYCRNVASSDDFPDLITLRRRRRLSQAQLAITAGVSEPTIRALEKDGVGRLSTLERVLTILGAGAYLAEKGKKQSFYSSTGNASVGQSWETPQAVLQVLYSVFGRFDLDPCSPRKHGPVKARVHFTAEDDGLSLPWHGRVFVNPPYGKELSHWIAKARDEFENGSATLVVLLIPARTETAYWHDYIAGQASVCFLKGRLKFSDGKQSAPFPSALVIFGGSKDQAELLVRHLGGWRAQ